MVSARFSSPPYHLHSCRCCCRHPCSSAAHHRHAAHLFVVVDAAGTKRSGPYAGPFCYHLPKTPCQKPGGVGCLKSGIICIGCFFSGGAMHMIKSRQPSGNGRPPPIVSITAANSSRVACGWSSFHHIIISETPRCRLALAIVVDNLRCETCCARLARSSRKNLARCGPRGGMAAITAPRRP